MADLSATSAGAGPAAAGAGLLDRLRHGLRLGSGRVALRSGTSEFGYEEMHRRALAVAASITAVSGEKARVGILTAGTDGCYVGFLAALYAGAAAVPLNPSHPPARVMTAARAAGVSVVVVDGTGGRMWDQEFADALPAVTRVDTDGPPSDDLQERSPDHRTPGVDEIAYIMFTSGSTGRPKGVPVTHGNVIHYLDAVRDRYAISADDAVTQTFEPTFDLFMFGFLLAWSAGATIVVTPPQVLRRLPSFVARNGITVWFSVPSTIRLIRRFGILTPGCLPSVTRSLFCGEALAREDVEAWHRAVPHSTVDNVYGPTELTIACTRYRWSPDDPPEHTVNGLVPIGRPHDGLSYVLLTDDLEPAGSEGELCMRGPQMFPGYLDAEDDDDRFVVHDGHRWYRTGDRVRVLPTGDLIYLGRRDHQVKVSGYRVELLEIENRLRGLDGVADCTVVLIDWHGVPTLAAFYTGRPAAASDLARNLMKHLPHYMVPRWIWAVDDLPLNSNGKTDCLALRRLAETLATGRPDRRPGTGQAG
jgi:amino acid adenylation domain-containing protein